MTNDSTSIFNYKHSVSTGSQKNLALVTLFLALLYRKIIKYNLYYYVLCLLPQKENCINNREDIDSL